MCVPPAQAEHSELQGAGDSDLDASTPSSLTRTSCVAGVQSLIMPSRSFRDTALCSAC
jgi:hypothetical protein